MGVILKKFIKKISKKNFDQKTLISFYYRIMKIRRQIVNTKSSPQAIGPYNQAILVNNTLYISGQLGMNPHTMELVKGGVEEQAIQVCNNCKK